MSGSHSLKRCKPPTAAISPPRVEFGPSEPDPGHGLKRCSGHALKRCVSSGGACCWRDSLGNPRCNDVADTIECRDTYGGAYQGDGVYCDSSPCCCCCHGYECQEISKTACEAFGGQHVAGEACDSIVCEWGACCNRSTGECRMTRKEDCPLPDYWTPHTCDHTPCGPGACCYLEGGLYRCSRVTNAWACESLNGRWLGDVQCSDVQCECKCTDGGGDHEAPVGLVVILDGCCGNCQGRYCCLNQFGQCQSGNINCNIAGTYYLPIDRDCYYSRYEPFWECGDYVNSTECDCYPDGYCGREPHCRAKSGKWTTSRSMGTYYAVGTCGAKIGGTCLHAVGFCGDYWMTRQTFRQDFCNGQGVTTCTEIGFPVY